MLNLLDVMTFHGEECRAAVTINYNIHPGEYKTVHRPARGKRNRAFICRRVHEILAKQKRSVL